MKIYQVIIFVIVLYISYTWIFITQQLDVHYSAFFMNVLKQALNFSSQQTNSDTSANSVDLLEAAYYEPSHRDLHYLLFCFCFLTDISVCKSGCTQIHRWKSPLHHSETQV